MANNDKAMQSILDGVNIIVDKKFKKTPILENGVITNIDSNGYTVKVNGVEYNNVKTTGGSCSLKETVKVGIPYGNYSRMFIIKSSSSELSGVSSVNGKSGDVILNASDVGALPNTTKIPSKTSDLTNDSNLVSDSNYVHTDNNFTTEYKNNVDSNTLDRHTHNNKTILDNTTASYTTTEQTKLKGIEEGAEVNVNADWNATSGDAEILNKPTSLPASDVYSWAKQPTKPTYTKSEVGLENIPNSVDNTIGGTKNSTSLITSGAVNGIEIGGRNILLSTKDSYTMVAVQSANYVYKYYTISTGSLQSNSKYTISANVSVNTGSVTNITVSYSDNATYRVTDIGNLTITNGKIKATFSTSNLAYVYNKILIYCGIKGSTANNSVTLSNVKLEFGDKATDWTPAPEDKQDTIFVSGLLKGNGQGEISNAIAGTDYVIPSGSVEKATQDASGNIITSTYGASLKISGQTVSLVSKSGTTLSSVTVPIGVMIWQ